MTSDDIRCSPAKMMPERSRSLERLRPLSDYSFMHRLMWVVPVAFFFLNPSFACVHDEAQFQYGAAEMRAAVEGNWSLTITPTGGTPTEVTVRLEQGVTEPASASAPASSSGHRLLRAAHACGTRTLVKSAGACIDLTQMPVAASYVSGDAAFSGATWSGVFTVASLVFSQGSLELMIGPYQILSQVNADGSLGDPHLGPGGTLGTLTVTRS